MSRARGTSPAPDATLDGALEAIVRTGREDDVVTSFAELARGFVAMISGPAPLDRRARAATLAHACAALYAGACGLLGVALDDDDAADSLPETSAVLSVVADWADLAGHGSYRLMVAPFEDGEPAHAELQDDLEEILAELVAGLLLYDEGGDRWRAAALEWRMDFERGWGRHLAAVLYASHCALAIDDR